MDYFTYTVTDNFFMQKLKNLKNLIGSDHVRWETYEYIFKSFTVYAGDGKLEVKKGVMPDKFKQYLTRVGIVLEEDLYYSEKSIERRRKLYDELSDEEAVLKEEKRLEKIEKNTSTQQGFYKKFEVKSSNFEKIEKVFDELWKHTYVFPEIEYYENEDDSESPLKFGKNKVENVYWRMASSSNPCKWEDDTPGVGWIEVESYKNPKKAEEAIKNIENLLGNEIQLSKEMLMNKEGECSSVSIDNTNVTTNRHDRDDSGYGGWNS